MNNKRNVSQNTPIPWQAVNSPLLKKQKRRTYTPEEKESVIKRYYDGNESVLHIMADSKIPKATIYNWIREYKKQQAIEKVPLYNARTFSKLEKRLTTQQEIIDILKTANCTIQAPLKKRLRIAESYMSKYKIQTICEALNIARGTFYNHILRNKRDNVWYTRRREELRIRIQEIYDESNQIFGAPKIAAVLCNEGIRTTRQYVAKLMRNMGLCSIRKDAKKFYNTSQRPYKNHLNQNFDTSAPNQVWVSDVTYFKLHDTQFYICAIIDLFARKVIAYKIGPSNSTQLVRSTIKLAYESRKPKSSLIFHTDRGSNYISKRVNDYLKSINIIHSYSRAHVPYDNSVMETFFSSMKQEELYRTKYCSKNQFIKAVDHYVRFYNDKRPHAKLQYKTPNQREAEYIENNEF